MQSVALWCISPGFRLNFDSLEAAKAMSGLVVMAAKSMPPIFLWYRSLDASVAFSDVGNNSAVAIGVSGVFWVSGESVRPKVLANLSIYASWDSQSVCLALFWMQGSCRSSLKPSDLNAEVSSLCQRRGDLCSL